MVMGNATVILSNVYVIQAISEKIAMVSLALIIAQVMEYVKTFNASVMKDMKALTAILKNVVKIVLMEDIALKTNASVNQDIKENTAKKRSA